MKPAIPHYALYGEADFDNELDLLNIETIADRGSTHHWEIKPHRHDHLMQWVWLERGRLDATVDDQRQLCYGPSLIMVPPTVVHGFNIQAGTSGLVISMTQSFVQQLLENTVHAELSDAVATAHIVALDSDNQAAQSLISTLHRLEREYRWPRRARLTAISGLCLLLMIDLIRVLPEEELSGKRDSQAQRQLARFRYLLEHHLHEHWSVKQYAQQMGLSDKRLTKICKQATDLTPQQIIHHRLLSEAKRHLVFTGMSINEVAYELGFKDPAYFSRFFLRLTGQQASQFRQNAIVSS